MAMDKTVNHSWIHQEVIVEHHYIVFNNTMQTVVVFIDLPSPTVQEGLE